MQIILMVLITFSGTHSQALNPYIKFLKKGIYAPYYLPEYDYISINKYYFKPNEKLPGIPPELTGASHYYLIHLMGPVYEDMKRLIESHGIKLIQYVPFNVFIARMDESMIQIIKDLPFVKWVGNYEPAFKLSPLFEQLPNEKKMLVLLFYDENINTVVNKLKEIGCEILEVSVSEYNKIIKLSTERTNLIKIACVPEIMYIEPWLETKFLNVDAQWVTQTWKQQNRRIWRKGVFGKGEIVNTLDSGIRTSHNMFRDPALPITTWGNYPTHRKIIAYQPCGSNPIFGDESGHGTHTAGTICGDDSYVGGTELYDGMPPMAKMYHMDLGGTLSGNLDTIFDPPYNGGARISSHAWVQTSGAGTYTIYCSQTDQFMWNHRDFLIFFAAGNNGPGVTTVLPPGTSKDIVTCGATGNAMNATQIANYSSRGPCNDTRYKPTITAPGILKSSYNTNDNSYFSMQGTSIATPCAAGNGALMRNYFAKGFYPTGDSVPGNQWSYISAAMVKAGIINGASSQIQGSTIPDNNTGWGRVHLDDVLYFTNDIRRLAVWDDTIGISTGEYKEYQIIVNNQSEPLKITLVWTDYYAIAGANPAIVNNLDLQVVSPGGTEYRGNQYSSGQSIPNPGNWDNCNVEENVRRNVPEFGNWTIRVNGTSVPQGTRQPFALVVTGGLGPTTIPVLHITGHRAFDPLPGGNQNGRIEPGETVCLTDTLKNLSNVDATNCIGILRTSSPYASLLDTVGDFGNIPVGAIGHNGSSQFRFTTLATTPHGTFVPFILHLTGDGGYEQDIEFDLMIGFNFPYIIWGPKQIQIAPGDTHFIYGCGYNLGNDRLYVCNAYEPRVNIYSSDSNAIYLGNITVPDTFPADIKYCAYDNTFWLTADWAQAYPDGKRVFKIDPSGVVLREFANPANDYPIGLAWLGPRRLLYLADRRTTQNTFPQYIYRSDTLGNAVQMPIPLQGNYGPRCLAIDPYGPDTTLLLVYTWFSAAGTSLDSVGLYELRRSDLLVLNRMLFPGWNARGVEYDPRDGNYWITIPQNPDRSIVKILGFHGVPVGIRETKENALLNAITLAPGIPNPFSNKVKIIYSIPIRMKVKLCIYDVTGRLMAKLVNKIEEPGAKTIEWDGRTDRGSLLSSGVYFCHLETEQGSLVRKLVYTR